MINKTKKTKKIEREREREREGERVYTKREGGEERDCNKDTMIDIADHTLGIPH